MRRFIRAIAAALVLAAAHGGVAGADEPAPAEPPTPRFALEFSLIDAPFVVADGLVTFPSMEQSLQLSNDLYRLAHWGILSAWGEDDITRQVLGGLSVAAFDIFSLYLPGGLAWLHEEWHRAVMSRRGISSFNDVYRFDIFSELIAVSHVDDDDLVRLKAEHPAEFVRLPAAGMEAEAEQNFALERENFFWGSRLFLPPLLAINFVGNISYLYTCATSEANDLTAESNAADGPDVERRDFTGLDCDAWVYDLHRPDEPYEARGSHPSGVGLDRYIALNDLSGKEKRFLRLQVGLSFLNLLDPQLANFRRFRGPDWFPGAPLYWNASVRHHLTSFGYTLDVNLLAQRAPYNLVLIAHSYVNDRLWFPGLEGTLERFPLSIGNTRLYLSPRVMLWLQPRDQSFYASAVQPGGLLALKAIYPITPWLETFLTLEGKTEGWVAGNVYLDPNLSVRAGVNVLVY